MIKIEISLEKGIEIVISYMEKSLYYWNAVEKHFLKKGIIDDIVPSEEMFNTVKNGSPELITYLLELI